MENDKYVVFKREDLDDWLGKFVPSVDLVPLILQDAIVIRRQDIFAGPGLFAYANAIQTALDLMDDITEGFFDEDGHLQELRDFFWEQAMQASHSETKKIPD